MLALVPNSRASGTMHLEEHQPTLSALHGTSLCLAKIEIRCYERRRRPEVRKPLRGRKVRNGKGEAMPLHNWIRRVLVCPYVDSPQAGRRSQDLSIIPLPSRASRHKFGRKQMVDGRGRSGPHKQAARSSFFVADVAKRFATAPPGDTSRRDGSSPFPPFRSVPLSRRSQLGHRDRLYDGAVSRDRDEVVVLGDPARLRRRPRRRRRWRRRRRRQRSPRAAHRAEVELGGRGRQGRVTLRLPSVMLSGPPRVSVDRRRLDVLLVVQVLRVPRRTESSPRCGRE